MGLETALMVSMGVNAAGSVFSAMSSRQQGRDEKAIYDANAEMLRGEAAAQVEKGRDEASLIKERARKLMASQIAAAGAGGGDLGGSTGVLITDSAFEAERDVQTTLRNANLDAQSLRNKANIQNAYGKAAKRAGNIRAITSLFQGAADMLPLYTSYSRMGGAKQLRGVKKWGGMNTAGGFGAPTQYGTMFS